MAALTSSDVLSGVISLVSSVPALKDSTGACVGGQGADPTSVLIPPPAAWVLHVGRTAPEAPVNGVVPTVIKTANLVLVMLYLKNGSQKVLLEEQLPILDAVIKAVNGKEIGASSSGGFRLAFAGEKLASVTMDRLCYEQRYSIVSFV